MPELPAHAGQAAVAWHQHTAYIWGEHKSYFVTGSRKGEMLRQSAQNRNGGLHTTARPSRSG